MEALRKLPFPCQEGHRCLACPENVETPAAGWKACPTLLGDESQVFNFEIQDTTWLLDELLLH
jgi:hypothetical protein